MITTYCTPEWTDNVVVQAPWSIIKGAALPACSFDLRTKVGARLFWALGFGGLTGGSPACTDLTTGINILIRPILGAGAAGTQHFAANALEYVSNTDPSYRILNGAISAGAVSGAFDGHQGKAIAARDKFFFWGLTAFPTTTAAIAPAGSSGCEVLTRTKDVTTTMHWDRPCSFAHADDEVLGLAETGNIWLPGGTVYEIIVDYTTQAAGEAVAFMARAQTYDRDTSVT